MRIVFMLRLLFILNVAIFISFTIAPKVIADSQYSQMLTHMDREELAKVKSRILEKIKNDPEWLSKERPRYQEILGRMDKEFIQAYKEEMEKIQKYIFEGMEEKSKALKNQLMLLRLYWYLLLLIGVTLTTLGLIKLLKKL